VFAESKTVHGLCGFLRCLPIHFLSILATSALNNPTAKD